MEENTSYPEQCQRPNCGHPKREHERHYQSIERKFHTPCQMAGCSCEDFVLSSEPEPKK